MRRFAIVQVDVFTKNRLEGNALAVVTDATGLTDQEMQALSKETNLSETTFVFPRDAATEKSRGVRVRIFTVAEELPFAGHPTLGTAFVLRGASGAPEVLLDLNVGSVPVRYEDTPGQPSFGEMRQRDPEFGARHDAETIARVTGLALKDIDTSVPIESVSTGLAYTIVPIKSLAALQNLRIDLHAGSEYLQKSGGKFFYFVSRETVNPAARLHARMLFYNGEDPATGSAAGCTAAWMAAHGIAAPNERVLIEQGLEMKRPSELFVRANRDSGVVNNVRVGGNCIEVMRGEITL
jgi:trans-2,3-dihydro-3-hydroxyanthranilate isomerase